MTSPSPYPLRVVRTPESIQPFTINWVDILQTGDAIATSTWTCDPALTITQTSQSASATTVWVSGGAVPTGLQWINLHAVNTITTNFGVTDQRTLVIFCKQL
jgi:hypothetical protein